MQVGSWWVITSHTLTGPWHVTSRDGLKGLNICDRAREVARDRNEIFFRNKEKLPMYLGKNAALDTAIAEVLKGA